MLATTYPHFEKDLYPQLIEVILQKTPSSAQGAYNNKDLERVTLQVVGELLSE